MAQIHGHIITDTPGQDSKTERSSLEVRSKYTFGVRKMECYYYYFVRTIIFG